MAENGADKNVRVEYDHTCQRAAVLLRRRNSLKSATSSSSSTSARALARRSAAAFSSERSAVLGRLRRVGTYTPRVSPRRVTATGVSDSRKLAMRSRNSRTPTLTVGIATLLNYMVSVHLCVH